MQNKCCFVLFSSGMFVSQKLVNDFALNSMSVRRGRTINQCKPWYTGDVNECK